MAGKKQVSAAGAGMIEKAVKGLLNYSDQAARRVPTPPPGAWHQVNEAMSPRAAAYQARITGRGRGSVYMVDGVKFDGLTPEGLVDAKGPGYSTFVDSSGDFLPWFQGADSLADQARRQVGVAGNSPVTWHVAEGQAATAMQRLLAERGIVGINIVHTP